MQCKYLRLGRQIKTRIFDGSTVVVKVPTVPDQTHKTKTNEDNIDDSQVQRNSMVYTGRF